MEIMKIEADIESIREETKNPMLVYQLENAMDKIQEVIKRLIDWFRNESIKGDGTEINYLCMAYMRNFKILDDTYWNLYDRKQDILFGE